MLKHIKNALGALAFCLLFNGACSLAATACDDSDIHAADPDYGWECCHGLKGHC